MRDILEEWRDKYNPASGCVLMWIEGLTFCISRSWKAYLWSISPATNFMTAFGFGALGTLFFALYGRDLK